MLVYFSVESRFKVYTAPNPSTTRRRKNDPDQSSYHEIVQITEHIHSHPSLESHYIRDSEENFRDHFTRSSGEPDLERTLGNSTKDRRNDAEPRSTKA